MARNDPIPVFAPNAEPNLPNGSETPGAAHPLAHRIQPIAVQNEEAAVVYHRFRGKIRLRHAARQAFRRRLHRPAGEQRPQTRIPADLGEARLLRERFIVEIVEIGGVSLKQLVERKAGNRPDFWSCGGRRSRFGGKPTRGFHGFYGFYDLLGVGRSGEFGLFGGFHRFHGFYCFHCFHCFDEFGGFGGRSFLDFGGNGFDWMNRFSRFHGFHSFHTPRFGGKMDA